jgi:hypothetical protein
VVVIGLVITISVWGFGCLSLSLFDIRARTALDLRQNLLADNVDGLVPIRAEGRGHIYDVKAIGFGQAQHFVELDKALSRGARDDDAALFDHALADQRVEIFNSLPCRWPS